MGSLVWHGILLGMLQLQDGTCCLQVKYPDQQTHLILPPLSDFRQLTALRHKLVTRVLLSHVLWSGKLVTEDFVSIIVQVI